MTVTQTIPRMGGGDPPFLQILDFLTELFPAWAGVILRHTMRHHQW